MNKNDLATLEPGNPDSLLAVTATGDVGLVAGIDSVKQRAILCIVAAPNATVFAPAFGAGIETRLGMAIPAARSAIAASVQDQVKRDERVKEAKVFAGPAVAGSEDRVTISAVIATVDDSSTSLQFGV